MNIFTATLSPLSFLYFAAFILIIYACMLIYRYDGKLAKVKIIALLACGAVIPSVLGTKGIALALIPAIALIISANIPTHMRLNSLVADMQAGNAAKAKANLAKLVELFKQNPENPLNANYLLKGAFVAADYNKMPKSEVTAILKELRVKSNPIFKTSAEFYNKTVKLLKL